MKTLKVLIVVTSLFLAHCHVFAQWISVSNGMGSARRIFSLYTNGNTILSGTAYNGAYISTDGGANWVSSSYNSQSAYSFLQNNGSLYAGTQSGIYFSTNGGYNWTQLGLSGYIIYSMAASGGNLFLATQSGVMFSQNGGANWTNTGLSIQTNYSVAALNNIVYSGTMTSGVYSTTNNGVNWLQTSLGNRDVRSVILNGTDVYCGTVNIGVFTGGVYFSSNSGSNWAQAGLNNITVFTLLKQGNFMLAGTMSNGLFYTSNNGANWIQKNQGLPANPTIRAIAVLNGFIYAGVDSNSVWRINSSEILGIGESNGEIPETFGMIQNYPNPFNPSTQIEYSVNKTSQIKIAIYNSEGNQITVLVSRLHNPGSYSVKWDGSRFPSGVYFCGISDDNLTITKKMILLK